MSDIFISYSRKDKEIVRPVVDRLSATGRNVWVDWKDIPWTADWWQEISDGIQSADNFVFVLSLSSLSSVVCNFEIAHAIENNKRIIPIVAQQANPQEAHEILKAGQLDDVAIRILRDRNMDELLRMNWQYLARHNWIFFNDAQQFEQSFANLINALDTDLDHVHKHTHFLMQATEWDTKDRENSFLLVGKEIGEAQSWLSLATDKLPTPTKLHTEYIFASQNHANSQQRRLLLGVSIALLVTAVLTVVAFFLWQKASFERDRADLQAKIARSGRVSLQGLLQLSDGRLDSALLLAVEAIGIYDNHESRSSLLTSLQSAPLLDRYLHADGIGSIDSVAYRPDGKQYATSDVKGQIFIWDSENKQPIGEPLVGHKGNVWEIVYSPDGQTLASVGEDGKLLLWDVATGKIKFSLPKAFEDDIFSVAFSPNGKLIATGHGDNMVRLWNTQTGELLNELEEHEDYVETLVFSPDGSQLASGGDDNRIVLWDVSDPENAEVNKTLVGHTNSVLGLDFSPDGLRLVSGGADHTVRLWDVATGQEIGQPFSDHTASVEAVEFSKDGQLLVSSSDDATLIFRDPKTGQQLKDVPPLTGHSNTIMSFAISPDSEYLISGDDDANLLLWNIHQNQPLSHLFAKNEGEIDSLAFSADGTRLLSGGHVSNASGSAILWDVQSQKQLFDPFTVGREVVSVAYSPDGNNVAYGVADGSVILRSVTTGDVIQTVKAHESAVRDIAISPDGKLLATASEDGTIKLWKTTNLELVGKLSDGSDHILYSIIFSPDGQALAVGDEKGIITLWNVASQKVEKVMPKVHTDAITNLTFNHNGDTLASASRDNTIVLWDVVGGKARGLPLAEHKNWVLDIAFSPNDEMLASGSRDNTIILWDVGTQHIIGQPLEGNHDWIWSITFSPDGKTLASGSRDGEIRLWDVDDSAWIARACSVVNRPLTPAEQALYLADVTHLSTACRIENQGIKG